MPAVWCSATTLRWAPARGLTVLGSNNLTFNGNLSGAGSLTKEGAATLTLNGTNSYTGGTFINAGTLAIGPGGSLAATGAVPLAAPGTGFDISTSGADQTIGSLAGVAGSSVSLGAQSLILGGVANRVFDGAMSGTGGRVFGGGDDAHQLDAARGQRLDQVAALGHRCGQHQPGQARTLHPVGQLIGQQRRAGIAGMDLQAKPGLAAGSEHAVLHADDVVRVRVVVDQPDHEGGAAAQVARGRVGLVVELGDGTQHPCPGGLHHRGLVVDHPRDRLQRDLGLLRNVLDGRSAHGPCPAAGRRDVRSPSRTGCTGSTAPSAARTPAGSRCAA
ncbi:hypothetical protein G6F50_013370 [Rhizopus delemar]|uniref:Uncharacterized protein n=1 Tax=Rhizopus delemar TaxID=936053 RepID=A0A9P6YIV7_9FUNG|nr:hypothetical protein G6F50_013370 [Rhizopus delemar]